MIFFRLLNPFEGFRSIHLHHFLYLGDLETSSPYYANAEIRNL
jgi:hypothetical protein